MLIPGIKLGPTDWESKISQSRAQFAEIWYRVDKPEWYLDLFKHLHSNQVDFGLHFWGTTSTGHEANLCHPTTQSESEFLIKKCLEVARINQAKYVNIHSGNTRPIKLDFNLDTMHPDMKAIEVSDLEACKLRADSLLKLGAMANSYNLRLLVELVPQNLKTQAGFMVQENIDRSQVSNQHIASHNLLLESCNSGIIGFCNDFCHTFSIKSKPNNRSQLFADFHQLTQTFAPYTKLIHINTLTPPYSGTDEHNGILDFENHLPGVFPTQSELISLLTEINQSVGESTPIYCVGEPKSHHVENYHALTKIIQSIVN